MGKTEDKQAEWQRQNAKPKVRPRSPAEDEETRWERTKANAKTIIGAVLLAVFIRIVLFEAFEIEGPSMEPTLLNGDRVVVAKFSYGLFLPFMSSSVVSWGVPNRGDVVIVNSHQDGIDIVKRVIALPGDRVRVEENVVYLNGEAVSQEELGACANLTDHLRDASAECIAERIDGRTYHTSRDLGGPPVDSQSGDITVPPGHVFVLGDHRDRSNDSRFFGPVSITRIKGRALMMYWSTDPLRGYRWDRMFDSVI